MTMCTKYLLHNFACTITLMANAITHYVSTAACTNWQVLNSGFLRSLVNLFDMRKLQGWSLYLWTRQANISVGYVSILASLRSENWIPSPLPVQSLTFSLESSDEFWTSWYAHLSLWSKQHRTLNDSITSDVTWVPCWRLCPPLAEVT